MTNSPNNTDINNITEVYDDVFIWNWQYLVKSPGTQDKGNVPLSLVTYLNNTSTNFDLIPWMNDANKQFYSVLRTPTYKNITAIGRLYSSNFTRYLQLKADLCDTNNVTANCKSNDTITNLTNFGRMFLFI
jgi:hypothetical protein